MSLKTFEEFINESEDNDELYERRFSQAEREKLASEGKALKDGSFPIATAKDLKNAIKAHGRASDPEVVKAHIIKRAKELGKKSELPEDWQ